MRTVLVLSLALLATAVLADSDTERNCHNHPWPYNNSLRTGEILAVGGRLASSTAYLAVEAEGLALYQGAYPSTSKRVWYQAATGLAHLTITQDGALVLVGTNGATLWSATTNTTRIAVVQDNCLFAAYENAPLTNQSWSTTNNMCITAHIVPHSHDDVGWLLTPERYYDGCYDPAGGVQSIIGTMVDALAANKSRTFVQVESYFFNRWWQRQDNATKQKCRDVTDSGQFTFINGGWSMHDEACVHQESAIANMAIGAQFIKQELKANLTIGWHIDPFGHASTTPRIMAQMGFNGFFFWRTDYEQREYMLQTKTLETMWDPSPSIGDPVQMFTSILYNDYCVGCEVSGESGFPMCPSPFCCYDCEQVQALPSWAQYFDRIHARDRRQTKVHEVGRFFRTESIDATRMRTSDLASMFAAHISEYAANFRTNQVLIPWGCDFQHIDASTSFALMDDVLTEINNNPDLYGIYGLYSTPQQYIDAVKNLDYSWPVNKFDYFLDSDNGHAYWSGYFSSRAEYKRFERWLMNHRSAVEIALSQTQRSDLTTQIERVSVLQQALGVAQHHDSITGTEREHVRNRYQFLLTRGLNNATETFSDVFESMTGVATEACFLSNLSSCTATEVLQQSGNQVSAYIYNPLGWVRDEIIVIPVPTSSIGVMVNDSGLLVPITAQVQPTWELTTSDDPTSPDHTTLPFELIIKVQLLPLSLLEIVLTSSPTLDNAAVVVTSQRGAATIANEFYTVTFNNQTGRISAIANKDSGISTPIVQNIASYCPMAAGNGQAAGAYIFRPCTPDALPTDFNSTFLATTLEGPICSEVRQLINPHHAIQQAVRLCKGQQYVDLTNGIGPVDPGWQGLEVVMKIQTDIASDGTWYTDSEGLELQQRLRNKHLNYPTTVTEPVASNFYPCNLFAVINGTTSSAGLKAGSLSVIADYSRATASLADGELEFLMIRRLLFDDNRGVSQPLNENIRILTTSRLIVNEPESITVTRKHSVLHAHPALVRFGSRSTSAWSPALATTVLPDNLLLHTRQQVADGVFLIRLQHIYAVGEGPLAVPVTFDLANALPRGITINEVHESDINGVLRLEDANSQRTKFNICDPDTLTTKVGPQDLPSSRVPNTASTVRLIPMDIRTYIVQGTWN